MNKKTLVAHRGDNYHFPENTNRSIQAALRAGVLLVEFDIQMNADHELLVIHDSDFKRTANLALSVFESKTSQLADISVHEPERFGDQFYPTPVYTLEHMLELLSQFPSATAFVEIKQESLDYFGLECVMRRLLNALHTHTSEVVIISFSYPALEYTQRHSNIKTGWVLQKYNENFHQKAQKLNPHYLICNYQKLREGPLWKGNWKWMAYTVNNSDLAKQLLDKGVGLIETNDIQALLSA